MLWFYTVENIVLQDVHNVIFVLLTNYVLKMIKKHF